MAYINAKKPTKVATKVPTKGVTKVATKTSYASYVPIVSAVNKGVTPGATTAVGYGVTSGVRNALTPAYNQQYENKTNDKKINSLADVILGTFGDMNRISMGGLENIPILNIVPSLVTWFDNGFVKPFTEGHGAVEVLGNLFVNELGEDFDFLNNIVKGVSQEGLKGLANNFALGGEGRKNYQWNTGNLVTDVVAEIISDPITWVELAVTVASWLSPIPGDEVAMSTIVGTDLTRKITDLMTNRAVVKAGIDATTPTGKTLIKGLSEEISKKVTDDVVKKLADDIAGNITPWQSKRMMSAYLRGDTDALNSLIQKTLKNVGVTIGDDTVQLTQILSKSNDVFAKAYQMTADKITGNVVKGMQVVGTANEQLQRYILKAAASGIYVPYKVYNKWGKPLVQNWVNSRTINNVINRMALNDLGTIDVFKMDEIYKLSNKNKYEMMQILKGLGEEAPTAHIGDVFVKKNLSETIRNLRDGLKELIKNKNYSVDYRDSYILSTLENTFGIQIDDATSFTKLLDDFNIQTNGVYEDLVQELVNTINPNQSILAKTSIKNINKALSDPAIRVLDDPVYACHTVQELVQQNTGMDLKSYLLFLQNAEDKAGQFQYIINQLSKYINPNTFDAARQETRFKNLIHQKYAKLLTEGEVANFLETQVFPLIAKESEEVQLTFIRRVLDDYTQARNLQRLANTETLSKLKGYVYNLPTYYKTDYTLNVKKYIQQALLEIDLNRVVEHLQTSLELPGKHEDVLKILNAYAEKTVNFSLTDLLADLASTVKTNGQYLFPEGTIDNITKHVLEQTLVTAKKHVHSFDAVKSFDQFKETIRKMLPKDLQAVDNPIETYIKQLEKLNKDTDGFYEEVLQEFKQLITHYENNSKTQNLVLENFNKKIVSDAQKQIVKEVKQVTVNQKTIIQNSLSFINELSTKDIDTFKASLEFYIRKATESSTDSFKDILPIFTKAVKDLEDINVDINQVRNAIREQLKSLWQGTENNIKQINDITKQLDAPSSGTLVDSVEKLINTKTKSSDETLRSVIDKLIKLGYDPKKYILFGGPNKNPVKAITSRALLESLINSDYHTTEIAFITSVDRIKGFVKNLFDSNSDKINKKYNPIFDSPSDKLTKDYSATFADILDQQRIFALDPGIEVLETLVKFFPDSINPSVKSYARMFQRTAKALNKSLLDIYTDLNTLQKTLLSTKQVTNVDLIELDALLDVFRSIPETPSTINKTILQRGQKTYVLKANNLVLADIVVGQEHYVKSLENIYDTLKDLKNTYPDLINDEEFELIQNSVISVRAYNTLLSSLDFLEKDPNKKALKTLVLDALANKWNEDPARFATAGNEWRIRKIISDVQEQYYMQQRSFNDGMDPWRKRTGKDTVGHVAIQDIWDQYDRALTDSDGALKGSIEQYSDNTKYRLAGYDTETTGTRIDSKLETSEAALCFYNEKPIKEGYITLNGQLVKASDAYPTMDPTAPVKGNVLVAQRNTNSVLPKDVLYKMYVAPELSRRGIKYHDKLNRLLNKNPQQFLKQYVYPLAENLEELDMHKMLLDEIVKTQQEGRRFVLMTCNGDNFDLKILRRKLEENYDILKENGLYDIYVNALDNVISFDILQELRKINIGEIFTEAEYDLLFNTLYAYTKTVSETSTTGLIRLLDTHLASTLRDVSSRIAELGFNKSTATWNLTGEMLGVFKKLQQDCYRISEDTYEAFKSYKAYNKALGRTYINKSIFEIEDIVSEFGLDFSQMLYTSITATGTRVLTPGLRFVGYNSFSHDDILHYFKFAEGDALAPELIKYYGKIAKDFTRKIDWIKDAKTVQSYAHKIDKHFQTLVESKDLYKGMLRTDNLSLEDKLVILHSFKQDKGIFNKVTKALTKSDEAQSFAITTAVDLKAKPSARTALTKNVSLFDVTKLSPEQAKINLQQTLEDTINKFPMQTLSEETEPYLERLLDLEKRLQEQPDNPEILKMIKEFNKTLDEYYETTATSTEKSYKWMFDEIERSSKNVEKLDNRIAKHHESFEYVRNYDTQLEKQIAAFTDQTEDLTFIDEIIESDPEIIRSTRRTKASALKDVNDFVTTIKDYYTKLPTVAQKKQFIKKQQQYMANMRFAQTMNALDILTNPDISIAEKQGHLFFNAKRVMWLPLDDYAGDIAFQKQIKMLFEKEAELAENHIRLVKRTLEDGREELIILLDKDFKVTRISQHERNVKYFANGQELVRPSLRDLDYDFIFKNGIEDDLDDTVITEAYKQMNQKMSKVTNGKHFGTAFEQTGEDFYRNLYQYLPDEARHLLPDIEGELLNPLYFTNLEYNHSLLGSAGFRMGFPAKEEVGNLFVPYDMATTATETVAKAYNQMDKKMQYISFVLDSEMNLASENSIWKHLSDEQIYQMLQNSPEYTVAIMAKRNLKILAKEGDRFADFKLTEFYINSPADVALARKYGASILPMSTYNIAYNAINEFEYISGFVGAMTKITNLFKMGYLMTPKNIISNTIDEFAKNVIAQGGFTDASNSLAYSTAAYFKFRKISKDIIKNYDEVTNETITEYFRLVKSADASFDEDLFRTIYNFLEEGPVGMTTEILQTRLKDIELTAYGRMVKASQMVLEPTSEVDRIMRLSQYLYEIRNGSTMLEGMEAVKRTHFAFSQKSEFERLAEIIFPFYGFTVDNASFWLQTLEKHPEYLRHFVKTQRTGINHWDPTGEKRKRNLSYQYAVAAGQIPISETGMTVKLAPSFVDVFQMFANPADAFESKLAGYIKEPINAIRHGVKKEPYKPEEITQAISNLIPIIGTLPNRVMTATRNYGRTGNLLNKYLPSIFGAIKEYEPYSKNYIKKTYPKKLYPKKTYSKKYYPKRAYFKRIWTRSYYNKFYNKYYGSQNIYYKQTYNRLPKRVYYKQLRNTYYDLYTKKGKARMESYLIPTTSRNLAYKIRYMQRYVLR